MMLRSEITSAEALAVAALAAHTCVLATRCPVALKAKLYHVDRGAKHVVEVHVSRPDGLPWRLAHGLSASDERPRHALYFAAKRVLAEAFGVASGCRRRAQRAINNETQRDANQALRQTLDLMTPVQRWADAFLDAEEARDVAEEL